MPDLITCQRCGRTTTDPDLWDPEAGTGRVFCTSCWDYRDDPMPDYGDVDSISRELGDPDDDDQDPLAVIAWEEREAELDERQRRHDAWADQAVADGWVH